MFTAILTLTETCCYLEQNLEGLWIHYKVVLQLPRCGEAFVSIPRNH